MSFVEPRFLLFFVLVLAVHWTLRGNAARKHWLTAASLFFYGSWDWRFLVLLVGCATVDYLGAARIAAARTRGRTGRNWLIAVLAYDLGTLGVFKYCNFFVGSGAELLRWLGLPIGDVTLAIVLPVGISFFTFQAMSYTIDVYRGQLQATRSYPDFLLFVTFFPQLVAGPIVRASTFLPQLDSTRNFGNVEVQRAVGQMLAGFFKKAVIADRFAVPVDAVFATPGDYSAASIWIATVGYAVQIYCDFSGYTDIAIGAARLLGYELCENFHFPYLATSMIDFWRRWHISLSSWLRDYLYIPLGGNRGSRWFTNRNLMLTMLLGGLWHGAAWHFVVWGAIHGTALIVNGAWRRRFGSGRLPLVDRLLTVYTVLLAWVFFRATNLADACTMARALLWLPSPGERSVQLWSPVPECSVGLSFVLLLVPLLVVHMLVASGTAERWRRMLPPWLVTAAYGVFAALALAAMPLDARPFLYFQF